MGLLSGVKDFLVWTLVHRQSVLCNYAVAAGKSLVKYALVPIESKLALSDAKNDQQKLASIIRELVGRQKLLPKCCCWSAFTAGFCTVADVDRLTEPS